MTPAEMGQLASIADALWPSLVFPIGFMLSLGLVSRIMHQLHRIASDDDFYPPPVISRYAYDHAYDNDPTDDEDDEEVIEETIIPTKPLSRCPYCGAPRHTNPCDYCGGLTE